MTRKLLTAAVLIVCVAIIVTTLFIQNDRVAAQDAAADSLNLSAPTLPNPFGNEVDWTDETLENRSHERDYVKLAAEFAKIASHADLEKMALELRLKIAEEKASRKMVEINKLLKEVVSEFPGTNGAKYAQHMLDGNECAGKTSAQPIEAEILQPAVKSPVKEPPAPPLADQGDPTLPKAPEPNPNLK